MKDVRMVHIQFVPMHLVSSRQSFVENSITFTILTVRDAIPIAPPIIPHASV